MELIKRPRRLRKTAAIRNMVRETKLTVDDLIHPIFVVEGYEIKREISSLKDVYHFSVDMLEQEVREVQALGINAVLLFGVPDNKDARGSSAYDDQGVVQRAIRAIKAAAPDMCVITDVCMCQYTDHGHCGIINFDDEVDNDITLEYLTKIAVSHAKAGADIVAPSDMMDGRVAAIRSGLDKDGFINVSIMSYAVKYASSFYGPFRAAADSAPGFGDRKTYQMDFHNREEALREAALDVEEGADFLMVKPALSYLDVVREMKDNFHLPVAVYNVSGEYAMIRNAIDNGILDEAVIYEKMISMKRAGADIIITYFARFLAENYL
ncbi:porphobilinogen synthase [Fusibacter sp. JL216-2]|uniref:porphobilinogen synthase n=1 Tax=Fusibacter sp. JL216-2 TaxID=3071453 RepID=UPI003D34C282